MAFRSRCCGCLGSCGSIAVYLLASYVLSILVTTFHMSHSLARWRCADKGPTNSSGLKVVMVSIGQTGTTSVVHALGMMGFRSYHMEDTMTFAPEALRQNTTDERWARAIRNCGIEAMTIEPQVDNLRHAIATSPDAVFIQTVRSYKKWAPSAIAGSTKDFVQLVHLRWFSSSAMAFPWLLLFDAATGAPGEIFAKEPERLSFMPKFGQMFIWYSYSKTRQLTPDVNYHHRGSYTIDMSNPVASFDAFFADAKAAVPSGRLHQFDVRKDSWAELSKIVGLPLPDGIGSEPFPHPRSSASWMNCSMVTDAFDSFLMCIGIWCGLHVVNWHIFWGLLRLLMSPFRKATLQARGKVQTKID